ncbi:naringenin,2-oxoglutarate 3-dioxygenase [Citrus sinensis]|uniref:Naringenin,2-oxoglutarate 3-dioxygenase n=1 Tax=Citrus sinensis TaxID=2711 RepID=A0ACB8M2P6_CITSI|nr:naringenin,2-oxoglutarate 3-dioxygenase [Citrus sinensis]
MAPSSLTAFAEEKTLTPSFVRFEYGRPKVAYNQFSNDIPVISLDRIDGNKSGEICKKIVEACEDWGIFQVDHGVDAKLRSDMTRLARHFFALAPEEKLKIDISGGKKGGFIVSSHLQGDVVKDWREIVTFFKPKAKLGLFSLAGKARRLDRSNKRIQRQINGTGMQASRSSIRGNGIRETQKEAFSKACVDMDQKIVVSYYPKCPQPDLTLGLKHQIDRGTITLPLQDQVSGLHATRDNCKTGITVQPVEGAFVVNLGDHGHYLSNGRFKNADHQAVVTQTRGEKPVMQEPIPFAEMYRRKMYKDLELARLKKPANKKQQQLPDSEKTKLVDTKPIENIFV